MAPNHPVQDLALEALDSIEAVERERGRADMVRALLTNRLTDWDLTKAHFPEYFTPEDPFEAAKTNDGEYDIDAVDDSQIEWGAPDSPETDEEISRWIAQHEHGSISAADMDHIY